MMDGYAAVQAAGSRPEHPACCGDVLARSLKLVAQRVALGLLLLLLAVSVLIFVGTQILPGDVAQSILGQSATPRSARQSARASSGSNDPAYVRYFRLARRRR